MFLAVLRTLKGVHFNRYIGEPKQGAVFYLLKFFC
jgi:hypothetical protein